MKLYFKMSELIHSDTAVIKKINNMPDINSLNNMLELIVNCLNPVREHLRKPMIVTSGYRCPELNKAVGGKYNSQHLKGQACDFQVRGMTPTQIVDLISKSNIVYDQLIIERSWVHISYNKEHNRRMTFTIL